MTGLGEPSGNSQSSPLILQMRTLKPEKGQSPALGQMVSCPQQSHFEKSDLLCSPGVHLREVMVKARPCNSGRREHEASEVSAHFPSHPKPKEAAGEARGAGAVFKFPGRINNQLLRSS